MRDAIASAVRRGVASSRLGRAQAIPEADSEQWGSLTIVSWPHPAGWVARAFGPDGQPTHSNRGLAYPSAIAARRALAESMRVRRERIPIVIGRLEDEVATLELALEEAPS